MFGKDNKKSRGCEGFFRELEERRVKGPDSFCRAFGESGARRFGGVAYVGFFL